MKPRARFRPRLRDVVAANVRSMGGRENMPASLAKLETRYLPQKRTPHGSQVKNMSATDIDAVHRKHATPESAVLTQIRDAVRGMDRVTLYRNSRGTVQLPGGGMLRYGVGPNGASDFVGWVSVRITPAMVGTDVAVFCAIEAKAPKENANPAQSDFLDTVLAAGGIAGVAHSGADAEAILRR